MIKTVTFDFGGVLYGYDGEKFLETLSARSSVDKETIAKRMSGSSLDRAHFKGEVEAPELLKTLEDRIGLNMARDDLANAYADIVEPNEEMFDLVRELENDYNLQLYSDTPKILYDHVMVNMPIFDLFSATILSFELGELKDSSKGYREMIGKSGHLPEEIVFIDDKEEVIDKANEFGINGVRFRSMEDLLSQLKKLGISPDGKFDL